MLFAQGPQGDVIGIAVKETIPAEGIRVVALCVNGNVLADVRAGIEEQAHVFGLGPSPGLGQGRVVERRVLAHAGHPCVDERLSVGALDAAGKRLVGRVFDARVQEAAVGEGQAEVSGHRVRLLALVELAVVHAHLAPFGLAPGDQVDDTGNGVAAVLRRSTVAENLHALQRDTRNHPHVRALRTLARGGHELGDERVAVAALAVDHHQHLVRRQTAQRRGTHERVTVARCDRGVEGRHLEPQVVGDVPSIARLQESIP